MITQVGRVFYKPWFLSQEPKLVLTLSIKRNKEASFSVSHNSETANFTVLVEPKLTTLGASFVSTCFALFHCDLSFFASLIFIFDPFQFD